MSKGNSYYEMNRDVFKNFVAREREFVKNVGEGLLAVAQTGAREGTQFFDIV